ncbi:phosphoenolpyruvate carboxykinase (ATP), partial [Pseudoalteromonas ruthenica]
SSATRFVDLTAAELVELAISRGEGTLAANGAFVAKTGRRTGRSPNDRFIVKEQSTENDIQWGKGNRPFDADKFDALWTRVEAHVQSGDHFVSHLEVGADPEHYLPVVVT